MNQEIFTFKNGETWLQGVHHLPEKSPAPYVISAHGMLSTKDSSKYTALGTNLVENGFGFVRFDFTGCGESSGDFADSTLTRRIEDLIKIIDWTTSLESCNGVIGLFGSSLGGTVAFVAGSQREAGALVLLATPIKQDASPPAPELQEVRKRYPHFFDDFRANLDSFPFKKIHHGLIIHGDQDQVVSPENAHFIYKRIAQPKKIWIVKGADHQFLDEALRESMLDATVQWFNRFLLP